MKKPTPRPEAKIGEVSGAMMTTTIVTGTIAAGDVLSGVINCKSGTIMRIYAPASWTQAPLSFQVSEDAAVFSDVFHSSGFEVTAVVVPGAAMVDVSADIMLDDSYIRLRSGTRVDPIAQDNDAMFTLVLGA